MSWATPLLDQSLLQPTPTASGNASHPPGDDGDDGDPTRFLGALVGLGVAMLAYFAMFIAVRCYLAKQSRYGGTFDHVLAATTASTSAGRRRGRHDDDDDDDQLNVEVDPSDFGLEHGLSPASATSRTARSGRTGGSGGGSSRDGLVNVRSTVSFQDLAYTIEASDSKQQVRILSKINGIAHAGRVLAVMGSAGAGKTSLLDILALRRKRGHVRGDLRVNGLAPTAAFRRLIGYVDQDDSLVDTLTVRELLTFSAMLRLPQSMPAYAKRQRVIEVMEDLRLQHVADVRIGDTAIPTGPADAGWESSTKSHRRDHARSARMRLARQSILRAAAVAAGDSDKPAAGLSEGERRKVSIAVELVTAPSVLILDDPLTGLDSHGAHAVADCLYRLSRDNGTAVILSVYQPRSSVFALFDDVLLLADGHAVYSGPAANATKYFSTLGFVCPAEYNPADFLIDVVTASGAATATTTTVGQVGGSSQQAPTSTFLSPSGSTATTAAAANIASATAAVAAAAAARFHNSTVQQQQDFSTSVEFQDHDDDEYFASLGGGGRSVADVELQSLVPSPHKTHTSASRVRAGNALHGLDGEGESNEPYLKEILASNRTHSLVSRFMGSDYFQDLLGQISVQRVSANDRTRQAWAQRSKHTASFGTQLMILSGRSMLHLYRKPSLLIGHVVSSVVVGAILGALYFQISTTDIAAIQNRLGAFFLMAAFLSFSSLSLLQVLWSERALYVHERANKFYFPSTYFLSKVLFDLIPLRIFPPVMLGATAYYMMGLRADGEKFLLFLLVLVLLNLAASSLCLIVGITASSHSNATTTAGVIMLVSLMFSNVFHNTTVMSPYVGWLHYASFFNYGFEALCILEFDSRIFSGVTFGSTQIEVTGAQVLDKIGFDREHFLRDIVVLSSFSFVCIALSYLALKAFVKLRR